MKKIWLVGIIVCTLLLIPGIVSADGNITITSSPAGATIILDDVSQTNVTPTTIYNVTTGSHTILLQLTGYTDHWVNITVSGDQTVSASLSVNVTTTATTATPTPPANVTTTTTTAVPVTNGSFSIESSPTNAMVYVNSVLKGYTPITVYNLTPDSYIVRIEKSGYLIYSQRFNVTAGNATSVSAILVAEPTATPTTAATAPPTTATTVTPRKTTTAKTYTPWPTNTPTQKSPLPVIISAGAIGIALVALRKK